MPLRTEKAPTPTGKAMTQTPPEMQTRIGKGRMVAAAMPTPTGKAMTPTRMGKGKLATTRKMRTLTPMPLRTEKAQTPTQKKKARLPTLTGTAMPPPPQPHQQPGAPSPPRRPRLS